MWATIFLLGCLMVCVPALVFVREPEDRITEFEKPMWWHCQAVNGTANIEYRWEFKSQRLPRNGDQTVFPNGTLVLHRVTYDDVGTYRCTANSGDKQLKSREATLQIASLANSFSLSPAPRTVSLGDVAELVCHITSLPPADVQWLLNGEPVSADVTVTTGTQGESILKLSPALYQHSGIYKCKATNPVNRVFKYSMEAGVTVLGQPVFLAELQDLEIPLGYSATFICSFHGNPTPTVKWYKHTVDAANEVTSKELKASSKYELFNNGTLRVHNVEYEDVAFYTCTAGNAFGEISESARLNISGDAEAPSFSVPPRNVTVRKGAMLSLECKCAGKPSPAVSWIRQTGERLNSSKGVLTFAQATIENMGFYTCTCVNEEGAVNKTVYLDVQTPPNIETSSGTILVLAGEAVTLNCVSNGNPAPNVSWQTPTRGLNLTSPSSSGLQTISSTGDLTLTSVQINDTGSYTCTASNDLGMATVTHTLQVEVAPVIVQSPVSQGLVQGSSVYLHCRAEGIPSPSHTWSRNGQDIGTILIHSQVFLNNTLLIRNLTTADTGVYRCTAHNRHGTAEAVATVTVTVPPTFSVTPRNQTVRVGESVALQCVANGDPVPTQWWLKAGAQLVIDNNMRLSTDKSGLVISNIRPSQFGEYSCVASNVAATNTVSAWLLENDLPLFTVYPRNITVNQSDTMTLNCLGQARNDPTVRWYRGQSGDLTPIQPSNRVVISPGGSLALQAVTIADEGWYMCELANSFGSVNHSAFINVQVAPAISSISPTQYTSVNSSVTLHCSATGDPVPSYEWFTPTGVLATPRATSSPGNVGTFVIASVQPGDQGQWSCRSCNLLGCDTAGVKILIEGLPEILDFSGKTSISHVELECRAIGQPVPTVTVTSGQQPVTSDLSGHTVTKFQLDGIVGKRVTINAGRVMTQYTCIAENRQGKDQLTITVPSTTARPNITSLGPGWATLSWMQSKNTSGLPLIEYIIQGSTDRQTWKDLKSVTLNITKNGTSLVGTSQNIDNGFVSANVSALQPYSLYTFRVLPVNILGRGSGESSDRVRTLAAAPDPPINVANLEVKAGIFVLMWDPPLRLNGPVDEVLYGYSVEKFVDNKPVKLLEGEILHNQTNQVEIRGLAEAGKYVLSVWSHNVALNKSSKPVTVDIDFTSSLSVTGQESPSDEDTLQTPHLIAVIVGSVTAAVLLGIGVCLLYHARQRKKTKSLSIVDHQLSLDQFYMENPRSLYEDDMKSLKRISRISFYSVESMQSNRSLNFTGKGSPHRDSLIESSVHLISSTPIGARNKQLTTSQSVGSVRDVDISKDKPKPSKLLHSKSSDHLLDDDSREGTVQKPSQLHHTSQSRPLSLPVSSEGGPENARLMDPEKQLTPLSANSLEKDVFGLCRDPSKVPSSDIIYDALNDQHNNVSSETCHKTDKNRNYKTVFKPTSEIPMIHKSCSRDTKSASPCTSLWEIARAPVRVSSLDALRYSLYSSKEDNSTEQNSFDDYAFTRHYLHGVTNRSEKADKVPAKQGTSICRPQRPHIANDNFLTDDKIRLESQGAHLY
ncbi:cell adhesion molecule DSCAML1-like [Dreissena polymorpha]|uniref:Uncharacterized protein n=1 Tax=Dreissena polymorpha TaxID=45954 RepID=A0A9D4J508_DREPO|nr:cell adhesion molecule DSCAML1-like [Dreissena polymorpha]XP_052222755.1 cell adhesion molecule DSCAML1-like [Dreissena polymorpha]KAH3796204.1 hypothetical protein DPMN_149772 [Dreissena polymorpha]